MDYYSQGNVPSAMGKNPPTGVTLDKVCKLLRAGQPLVWAVAIVLTVLGVSWTIRHFWRRKRVQDKQSVVLGDTTWTPS
jgi:hypothetical protein